MADVFDQYAMADAWDEMFAGPGEPRPAYRSLFATLQPPLRGARSARPAPVWSTPTPPRCWRSCRPTCAPCSGRTPPGDPVGWDVLRSPSTVDERAEYLAPTALTAVDDELSSEAAALVNGADPTDAALALSGFVRDNVAYVPGSTGVRTSGQEAWAQRKGVCQDLAHLTVGLLRGVGIPARYVSGYLYPKASGAVGDTVAGQSHAWVEWWTGEWTPFDPTNGVPVGPGHVVVARGRDYADVTPLKGVYHGAPSSGLGVTVEITRLA